MFKVFITGHAYTDLASDLRVNGLPKAVTLVEPDPFSSRAQPDTPLPTDPWEKRLESITESRVLLVLTSWWVHHPLPPETQVDIGVALGLWIPIIVYHRDSRAEREPPAYWWPTSKSLFAFSPAETVAAINGVRSRFSLKGPASPA